MKCPRCNHEWKLPGPQAGGRAKVKKGFSDPRVQAKAQATRKRKALDGQNSSLSELIATEKGGDTTDRAHSKKR